MGVETKYQKISFLTLVVSPLIMALGTVGIGYLTSPTSDMVPENLRLFLQIATFTTTLSWELTTPSKLSTQMMGVHISKYTRISWLMVTMDLSPTLAATMRCIMTTFWLTWANAGMCSAFTGTMMLSLITPVSFGKHTIPLAL